jgi:hypothetical protein
MTRAATASATRAAARIDARFLICNLAMTRHVSIRLGLRGLI